MTAPTVDTPTIAASGYVPVPATARERSIAAAAEAKVHAELAPRLHRTAEPTVTASATRLEADPRGRFTVRRRAGWQDDVFAYVHSSPELGFASRYVRNAFEKISVHAAVRLAPDEDPVPIDTAGAGFTAVEVEQAQAEVARLRSATGGQGPILGKLGGQLFLVGDCWLIGRPATAPRPTSPVDAGRPEDVAGPQNAETWDVLSISELVDDSGHLAEKRSADGRPARLPAGTVAVRVHQPDLEFSDDADSSVRAVLDDIEGLAILNRREQASDKSAMANSDVWFIAKELSEVTQPGQDPVATIGEQLMGHALAPITDPASASAVAPFIIEGPKEYAEGVKRIESQRSPDPSISERYERRAKRVATGLDLPVEVITGIADLNHWSAWQVKRETFDAHLKPKVVMVVDALTVGLLRLALQVPSNAGGPGWTRERAERVCVWFDESELVSGPDEGEVADQAFPLGVLSEEAYRQRKGIRDTEIPTEQELLRRQALGLLGKPAAAAAPGAAAAAETTPASPVPSDSTAGGTDAVTAAARARRGETLSRRLLDIDRDLRARLEQDTDRAVLAAIDRAGSVVLRAVQSSADKAPKTAARGVPRAQLPRTLGRPVVAALGLTDDELLAQAFDDLRGRYEEMTGAAQEQARAEIADATGMTPEEVEAFAERQATSRQLGWEVLLGGLLALTAARLFTGEPDPEPAGEASGLAVPVVLLRRALGVAGGRAVTEVSGLGGAPLEASGVATGGDVTDLLTARGARRSGYEWVYGISRDRFAPHVRLTGVRFEAFDDEQLRNREPWPNVQFLTPGDHDGCRCDAYPLWALADDESRFFPQAGVDDASGRAA